MSQADALPRSLTIEAFLAWTLEQPEGRRYELAEGEVVAMAPERAIHATTKARVWRALDDAVRAGDLPCEAFPDGMLVRAGDRTGYEPDALLRCGPKLPPDTILILDPLVVVEVVSPASGARDKGAKLEDYFRLPSVRHYLILKTDTRAVIHHARGADGRIATSILHAGELVLDPPGITLPVASLFE